jgi:cell division transport system permease protein
MSILSKIRENLTPGAYRFLPDSRSSGGVLPWVIAVMVYLMALSLAGALGLRNAASGWSADLSRTMTIQVSTPDPAQKRAQVERILFSAGSMEGVERIAALSPDDERKMLEPFLGKGNVGEDLPIPAMIDVVLTRDSRLTAEDLQRRIGTIAPNAKVDDHQQWLGQLHSITRTIEWTALLVLVLVALSTCAIVAFGTRAGLSSHKSTIEILHMMGAEDDLVAREFQWRFLLFGVQGGVVGLLAALGTLLLLGWFIQQVGQGLIGSMRLNWTTWLALLSLPVLAGLLTMFTAKLTVHRALANQL